MQDYFHQHMFADNPKALVDLSFVGTLALVFINGSSPIVQYFVARFGLRPVMIVGTLFITIALEMAGFASQVKTKMPRHARMDGQSICETFVMTEYRFTLYRSGICT